MSENNFLEQNSQHRECKTGDSVKTERNSKRPKDKHNGINEKGICVRSKHKYELKLKIKGTKKINITTVSNQAKLPKIKKQSSQTKDYYELMTLWMNMT